MGKNRTAGQTNTQPQAKETNVKTNPTSTDNKGANDSKNGSVKK